MKTEKTECEICGRKFGEEKSLQQHMQTKHEKEEKEFKSKKSSASMKKIGLYAIVVIVVIGIIYILFLATQIVPTGIGPVGSEHTHSTFTLTINGKTVDFSSPAEQMHTKEVHFENADGKTVHKHATGITIGYFFKTIPLAFNENCMEFKNVSYCPNGKKFVFSLNGKEVAIKELLERNLLDRDSFSIIYG